MARVLEVFEPPDGGVPQAVGQLAGGLGAHGFAVGVAGPRSSRLYGELPAGVAVHRLALERTYGAPHRDALVLGQLVRLVRDGGYDLVHCHSAKAGVLGRVAARVAGVPAVYSPHCLPFVGEVSALRRHVARELERALRPLTGVLLCACEHEREVALAHGLAPDGRVAVVANGARADVGTVDVDQRLLSLRGEGLLVGAVAALREQKGLPDLLRAAPGILARVPHARIAIVGDGPCRAALELQAAALGLADDPRFALMAFQGPPERHLRALDLFVLPSLWEALPIGALEAMAGGVPQVATRVGGTAEAVTEATGRLVDAHDPAGLGEAITDLLSDPAGLAQRAAASRSRHAERFSVQRAVAEVAAVYGRVLNAAASTGGGRRASA